MAGSKSSYLNVFNRHLDKNQLTPRRNATLDVIFLKEIKLELPIFTAKGKYLNENYVAV